MSESLQGRHTTSNSNTWVANSYHTLYDKGNRCVLSRFLNVDIVGAVRMSRGKLFHAVGPETENARLPSWRLVRGMRWSPRTAERTAEHVATVVTGTLSSFMYITHSCTLCIIPGPVVDPNAPKPEGSTVTPTIGEQLIVSDNCVLD